MEIRRKSDRLVDLLLQSGIADGNQRFWSAHGTRAALRIVEPGSKVWERETRAPELTIARAVPHEKLLK
jgi:hypothetical protein